MDVESTLRARTPVAVPAPGPRRWRLAPVTRECSPLTRHPRTRKSGSARVVLLDTSTKFRDWVPGQGRNLATAIVLPPRRDLLQPALAGVRSGSETRRASWVFRVHNATMGAGGRQVTAIPTPAPMFPAHTVARFSQRRQARAATRW